MKSLLSISLLVFGLAAIGQNKIETIDFENNIVMVNNLDQLLVANETGLHLINRKGELIYQFSENLLGEISSLDLTTAMRPMIFYGQIPAFQVLDNTLSAHGPLIELIDLDLQDVTHMCASSNNGFWTYDPIGFELKRLNSQLKVQTESGNIMAVIGKDIDVTQLFEDGNRLYVNDRLNGIHLFDFYGNFIRTIEGTQGAKSFHVSEDKLVFIKDSGLSMLTLSNRLAATQPEVKRLEYDQTTEQMTSVFLSNGMVFSGQTHFIQIEPFQK